MEHRKQLGQEAAAAKAGISVRSARRIEHAGGLPSQPGTRQWRTRADPLSAWWESDIAPLLASAPALNAVTILEELQRRYPIEVSPALLRTLQRRLRHWRAAYFKLAETKRALEERDGWIRHKLRCVLWRQWKRVYTRARNLMQRGLTEERAWRSATNGRGPWWNAGASHMNAAFPKSWFDRLGLVSLLDTVQRLQRVS